MREIVAALAYRGSPGSIGDMVYSVVPKALADELYPKLVEYYRDDDNVTVIVERREFDRRARQGRAAPPGGSGQQRRVVRDRRRARVPGDLPPLAHATT
jgi:hypothetical protein